MTDEGKQDHWAELASLLGAEPAPVEDKRPEPVRPAPVEPDLPAVASSPVMRTVAAPAAQQSAHDWVRLAEQLGIAVPVEVPEPVSPKAQEWGRVETVTPPPVDAVPSQPSAVVLESVETTTETEVEAIEVLEEVPADVEMPSRLFESVDTEDEAVDESIRQERTGTGRRRRKRRRRGRRPEASPADAAAEDFVELPEPTEDVYAVVEEVEEESVASSAEDREGRERVDEGQGRSRRRRRRRKKKPGEQQSGDVEAAPEGEEFDTEGDESTTADDEHFDEQLDEHADFDDDADKGIHHGIPTWEEAIGVVIGTNLEARARNPGGGGNNRGRGRGRSGRDRRGDR